VTAKVHELVEERVEFGVLGRCRDGSERGGGQRDDDGEQRAEGDEGHGGDATEAQPPAPIHSRAEVA